MKFDIGDFTKICMKTYGHFFPHITIVTCFELQLYVEETEMHSLSPVYFSMGFMVFEIIKQTWHCAYILNVHCISKKRQLSPEHISRLPKFVDNK
jgi:hypothetical protein